MFFFFYQKTAYEMRISGCSSDVCSSDRILYDESTGNVFYTCYDGDVYQIKNIQDENPTAIKILSVEDHGIPRLQGADIYKDRKSVVWGKRVSVRVDLGGRSIIKNKMNVVVFKTLLNLDIPKPIHK